MEKMKLVVMMMSCALMAFMAMPAMAHDPIPDETACPTSCDPTGDPLAPGFSDYCIFMEAGDPFGSDPCFTDPLIDCLATWPTVTLAGMPTWNIWVRGYYETYGTPDESDDEFIIQGMNEETPFSVILPAPGTFDFCGWMDHLFCSLMPFAPMLPEIGQFAFLIQCANMDINGPIAECFDIPVKGNGIPERYELAILAEVLNNTGHPLHASAIAALQNNATIFTGLAIEATRAVDGGDMGIIDVRQMSYGIAPWLLPSLGGTLAAAATVGDPLTNAALDSLLVLLADLGIIADPVGTWAQSVPATGQAGDISGNGFTNGEIYKWYIQAEPTMTVDEYVLKAFDPTQRPPARVDITGNNQAAPGSKITLRANVSDVVAGAAAETYQWYRWGLLGQLPANPADPLSPMCDDFGWMPLEFQTGSSLALNNVTLDDVGEYKVEVGMATNKAVSGTIEATILVEVDESFPGVFMPVGGALGLTVLAGLCAFAGAVGIRRRK